MCLAYENLRAATNKYGLAPYHTHSQFPENVRFQIRCSQMLMRAKSS